MAKRKAVRIGPLLVDPWGFVVVRTGRAYCTDVLICKKWQRKLGAKPGDILYAYVVKPAKKRSTK